MYAAAVGGTSLSIGSQAVQHSEGCME